MKKDIERALYSIGALALVVVVTWLFSLTIVSRDTQQARVTSSTASKYPTSDEALKTLMSERARTTSFRDRDFASACVAGAIKCGKIVIEKSALPESNLDFTFYTNVPNYPSFMLDDDATLDNSALPNTQTIFTSPNGNYIVAEMPSPSEYSTVLACSDPSGNSVVLTGSVAAVIINMNAGETVNCTFRNIMVPQEPMACEPDTWTQKADFGGVGRNGATGFSIGTKGYIGTGYNNLAGDQQDFWEYDPSSNIWTQRADFGGGLRSHTTGFSIANMGYITSGLYAGFMQDLWEYNPVTNVWTEKANFSGTARYRATAFSIGPKGYMGTGSNGSVQSDFWEYDPIADAWTQMADFAGGIRMDAVGFSVDNMGYMGTGIDTLGNYYNDFWEYDPTTNIWTQMADVGGAPRIRATGLSIGTKGYIGNGTDEGTNYLNDFWEYDPIADEWTEKADVPGFARNDAVGFSIGGQGYVGTGWSANPLPALKDFWEYCP